MNDIDLIKSKLNDFKCTDSYERGRICPLFLLGEIVRGFMPCRMDFFSKRG